MFYKYFFPGLSFVFWLCHGFKFFGLQNFIIFMHSNVSIFSWDSWNIFCLFVLSRKNFPLFTFGMDEMAFHKADLVRTLNRNPVFFSICSIWGAYFVTWVWLLKFYVCVHFQSILTHFLPECGRLGIQSTYLWSGASLEAWEGFTPLHSFSSV